MHLTPLPPLHPPSPRRAWHSTPHPTLPLLSTSLGKSAQITSLRTSTPHSILEGGHTRSIRSTAWKPHLRPGELGLVTGSFDGTAGVWRRDEGDDGEREDGEDWEFSVVLEGHDAEVKNLAFSPSGQYLATCSRDKSIWIWEEVDGADEWETVAVLTEHEGDVKCVAWAPSEGDEGECLASASYDGTVRVWREDGEGEWGCVGVLEGGGETVWGVAWEGAAPDSQPAAESEQEADAEAPKPKHRRLITCSADTTLRVWKRVEAAEAESGGIPSTMRAAAQGEKWVIEATLPAAHTRAVYAVAWSERTGRVVSCGGDSRIVVYGEVEGGADGVVEGGDGEKGEGKEGEKGEGKEGRRGRGRWGMGSGRSSPQRRWVMDRMRLIMLRGVSGLMGGRERWWFRVEMMGLLGLGRLVSRGLLL
ncbi:Cytosolic iron-sulfur protein assembly protein [Pseudogymnoascus destructans]|uniref:Probable cytosolic iron-sulfur protein assembly protein 1 n=1 Tax=Pseudogymnoascus destructans TaxID=655981 RepID=A0A176ZWA6_9PEZI|nr:Cytosolic iron-sulfur protein assembly protein [Pseudogymnoascus destructans]OAF54189.1 Cytosolic iron-sulfur protein assembly protein [Pseudogymnoascus destructans]